jgi:hypothetical protein
VRMLEELQRISWNGTATSPRVLLFTGSTRNLSDR